MKFPIIIKQSPLALIRRLIAVEILIAVALFFLSLAAINYHALYDKSPISGAFRFSIFLVLGASAIQLLVTFFVFLSWHNEEYRLKEKEIVHRKGIFLTHERSIMLKNISSVDYKRSWMEFLFGYGSIYLNNSSGISKEGMKISSVETPEIYANIIKDAIDLAIEQKRASSNKLSILDLILEGESSSLELKQTFRYDGKTKDVNKALEKATMKTIAAFLNANGGNLIIGVTDNGRIHGVEEDYHTLIRKDRDGFENHFNQVLKLMIGAEFRQHVKISFEKIEDKDVCLVQVDPSHKPVYVKANGDEEFFIRTGNTTSPLKVSEVNSYIDSHWQK
jgi:membrane protein YdbS with pleckstrin-like domain